MAQHHLTDTGCKAAKPQAKVYSLSDGGGLSLRVRPTGSKTWVWVFWLDGKQRRMGLGSYPSVGLAEARKRRDEAKRVRENENPIEARRKEKEAARRAARGDGPPRTVEALFEKWRETELSTAREDGGKRAAYYFERDVLPLIGDKPLADVSQADIWAIRDRMRSTKRPRRAAGADGSRLANMLLADMRQLFTFGVARGYSTAQPTAGIKARDWGGAEHPRARWLPEGEIADLAGKLSALSEVSQIAFWILLGTGSRVGETYVAKWDDVDFDARTWFLPAGNRKGNKRNPASDHILWLSDFTLARLRELHAHTGHCTYLWPHKRDSDNHAPTNSLRRQIADCGEALHTRGGPWTPHDLRRTAATLMLAQGTTEAVVHKCLGHYARGDRVSAAYFHYDYADARVHAWARLGETLQKNMPQPPSLRSFP